MLIFICLLLFLSVGGPEGVLGLERLVRSGEAVVAFCVHEVSVEKVMQIADAGMLMPPKVPSVVECINIFSYAF